MLTLVGLMTKIVNSRMRCVLCRMASCHYLQLTYSWSTFHTKASKVALSICSVQE